MIKNTSKNPNIEWLFGGNPNAIEAQEKEGQNQLVDSSFNEVNQLPKKGNGCDAIEIYESLGFKIIGESEGDNLFIDVVLPKGWFVKPTGHSMWSNLVDDKSNIRASIFYKAAFYDRKAFINKPNTRYSVRQKYFERGNYEDAYEGYNNEAQVFQVFDGDKVIFETEPRFFKDKYAKEDHSEWWNGFEQVQNEAKEEAIKWVSSKYPEWEDSMKYWN